jgi:hypothetical protein
MAFYGDSTKAEALAGTVAGTVTAEMQSVINEWINLNIRMDGFTEVTADEYYDIRKSRQAELVLEHYPVTEITGITNAVKDDSPVDLASDDYVCDEDSGIIQLLLGQFFAVGFNQVRVQYKYGYTVVPSDIAQIATMMAAKWAKIRDQQADADGIKQVKIGDYQETRDISFMMISSEFDDILKSMIKKAQAKYQSGV